MAVLDVDSIGPQMLFTDEGRCEDGPRFSREVEGRCVVGEDVEVAEGW